MEEINKRFLKDRRKQPTTWLNRYIVIGQRRGFRRNAERLKGGYVDRYDARFLFILTLILGLNILDALFTMMVIDLGGVEINPIVLSVMHLYGDNFWIWKCGIVSFPLILLCLHSGFRRVKPLVVGICIVYLIVVFYQMYLVIYQ